MLTGLQAGKEYSLSTAFPTWAWSHPSTELSLARSLRRIKLSNPIPLIYSDTPHHGCAYTATNLFIHPQTFLWVNKWNEGIIILKKKFNLPFFGNSGLSLQPFTLLHFCSFLYSVFCLWGDLCHSSPQWHKLRQFFSRGIWQQHLMPQLNLDQLRVSNVKSKIKSLFSPRWTHIFYQAWLESLSVQPSTSSRLCSTKLNIG